MVPDVATGDRMNMLCLNCARRTVSRRSFSKYGGITQHLKFRAAFTGLVKLSFARIDGLIGSNLPMNAYREEKWWTNAVGNAHAKGWLDAGWEVKEVNLGEGFVVFKKVRQVPFKKARRKSSNEIKPFTPVPVRSSAPKVPSKTKVSRLYARIKNLERQRAAGFGSSRGFKPVNPKPQNEKKLFWSEERPK
jgi:hypothetical protein